MNAAAVMNRNVVAVTPDLRVEQIVHLLITREISAVPVVDAERRLVGMVGVDEVVRAEAGAGGQPLGWWTVLAGAGAATSRRVGERSAGEVMSRDVVTVEEDTPIRALIELLAQRRIKRVPVVKDGRLAGLVTRVDVLHALNACLPRHGRALDALLDGRPAAPACAERRVREDTPGV